MFRNKWIRLAILFSFWFPNSTTMVPLVGGFLPISSIWRDTQYFTLVDKAPWDMGMTPMDLDHRFCQVILGVYLVSTLCPLLGLLGHKGRHYIDTTKTHCKGHGTFYETLAKVDMLVIMFSFGVNVCTLANLLWEKKGQICFFNHFVNFCFLTLIALFF